MSSFVAIDFETANESRSSACEISLVRFKNGKIEDRYTSLLYQDRFSAFNTSIHGIRPQDVASAPRLGDIWHEVRAFIGDLPLVAHNAGFDISVMHKSLEGQAIGDPIEYFCTMVIGRRFLPIAYFSLESVANHLGIDFSVLHRAENDAIAAGKVAIAYFSKTETGDLLSLAEKFQIRKGILDNDGPSGCFHISRGRQLTAAERAKILESIDSSELYEDPDFVGKKVVFTGELDSMTRVDAQMAVLKAGGLIVTGVSTKTNLVVTGYQDPRQLKAGATKSNKLAKAEELREQGHEIEIIDELMFREMLQSPSALNEKN